MRTFTVLVIVSFLILCGCKRSPDKQAVSVAANLPPTATEVFHLRSECAQLGQKILEANVIGNALTQSQVSHYDPPTNRCYVELTVQTADLTKPTDYFADYLFDGQTGEMLATAKIEKEKKSGIVYGVAPPDDFKSNPDTFYDQAIDFINGKMADDRKN